ncbi:hypothetical protein GS436_23630 [Rhodococcus hoagii]|nr:hypothetical protein [Prescottella equi]
MPGFRKLLCQNETKTIRRAGDQIDGMVVTMPSILITGATNGLGLVLAEELAEARHRFASARSQPAVTGCRSRNVSG